MSETQFCPLCEAESSEFFRNPRRVFHRCERCSLVFVPTEYFVSVESEKAIYELHENSPDDAGYRRFLSRMLDPIIERFPVGSRGLDFGCGPGPTLSVMFGERGYKVADYDPLYEPNVSLLDATYDFVTATEVVEHFRDPKESLGNMWNCVTSGGILGVMTKLVIDQPSFSTWHYIQDPSHICFFSRSTFRWLAIQWNVDVEFIGNDVVVFPK